MAKNRLSLLSCARDDAEVVVIESHAGGSIQWRILLTANNSSMRCSIIEVLSVPLLGFHFFFSSELSYRRAPKKPHLERDLAVSSQSALKSLDVCGFIVQNDPSWS